MAYCCSFAYFTESNPSVTIEEASNLCDVSKPTIRNNIKKYGMHTWKDDRGVIHIRTLDLLPYYRTVRENKLKQSETLFKKANNLLNKRLKFYDDIRREFDDMVDDCDDYSYGKTVATVEKARIEMLEAGHIMQKYCDEYVRLLYEMIAV